MNVYVFDTGSICIHGEELLRQFTFLKNTGKHPTLKQMFEISEKLILEQSDEIFGVSQISWENSRSQQSLTCKGLCILRFCVMSWKCESEPNIKYCLGTAVGLVQRFITIQNFGQLTENRWNSSGIFSQDSLHCSSSKKSKSS